MSHARHRTLLTMTSTIALSVMASATAHAESFDDMDLAAILDLYT